MAVYLVTWDLNKEKTGYTQARNRLIMRLNEYEHTKDPGLDSVWFISTNWDADQIDQNLREQMDKDDRLIVTKLEAGKHQGWLNEKVWNWINARI